MRAAIPRTDMQGTRVAVLPRCMTVWCLESEQAGTPRLQIEGGKRKLSDRPQDPMLGTNAVFHTMKDVFPRETGAGSMRTERNTEQSPVSQHTDTNA